MKSIVVFSKNNCVWCDRLKELLKAKRIGYTELNIDEDETAMNLAIAFKFQTMPQVISDREFLGGYQETARLLDGE